MIKYTTEHLYARHVEGKIYYVGVTETFVETLEHIEYIQIPSDDELSQGDIALTIHSKCASEDEFEIPFSCNILEKNEHFEDYPEDIKRDPEDEDWVLKVEIHDEEELENMLTSEKYSNLINGNW
jgi:glycine cleavage system H protein